VRAVIDTSAWVSGVLSRGGRSAQLIQAFNEGRFNAVTSEPALAEVEEVLERPDLIVTGTARMTARALLAALRNTAEVVPIAGALKICRDPKDDMIIETAAAGGVDVLVSEDKDLTADPVVIAALAQSGIRVLPLAQFLDELGSDA
jgi:putative PIN family toxin of toxin-antitoxin system